MHDIRSIRENPAAFDAALARRGLSAQANELLSLDSKHRSLITEAQLGQARRNEASKAIGAAKATKDEAAAAVLMAEVASLKERLPAIEAEEKEVAARLKAALEIIPNLPADDVPDGANEQDNVEVAHWGTPRTFEFTPREHADLGPALGMDFETGVRLSGARFTFLRGDMARLHRALGQFMLDVQTREHGYEECNPPVLVKDETMYGTDKLPKFADDSFLALNEFVQLKIANEASGKLMQLLVKHNRFSDDQMRLIGDFINKSAAQGFDVSDLGKVQLNYQDYFENNVEHFDKFILEFTSLGDRFAQLEAQKQGSSLWLIPTSEVPLTASVMGELLDERILPMRLTALTPCFRSEAGAAGKDTRGFIRQHQFEKCELVSIVRPEDSEAEHERMTRAAETILERLNLPYRKLLLCTGDMGFGARKTYDLEVWLPGQAAFREISSCSNTGAFQARRMNTRYRMATEKKTDFVHTLNGSGLAVGRTLVAVIENCQNEDGSVTVPEALQPYMGGINRLQPA